MIEAVTVDYVGVRISVVGSSKWNLPLESVHTKYFNHLEAGETGIDAFKVFLLRMEEDTREASREEG